jgi:hypothetical protein
MEAPFPDDVVKGTDYGGIDCVMVGADVYGWVSRIASGEQLSSAAIANLTSLATDLRAALWAFPESARSYYEQIADLADEGLRVAR